MDIELFLLLPIIDNMNIQIKKLANNLQTWFSSKEKLGFHNYWQVVNPSQLEEQSQNPHLSCCIEQVYTDVIILVFIII